MVFVGTRLAMWVPKDLGFVDDRAAMMFIAGNTGSYVRIRVNIMLSHYIALDQSPELIGYAIGAPNMIAPLSGIYKLPKKNQSLMLQTARDWLTETVKLYNVEKVCYEAVFYGNNAMAAGLAHQLVGVILLVCADHNIPTIRVPCHNWRKHFMGITKGQGKTQYTRRKWLKEEALTVCYLRKWDVKTHDEAEACGILDYVLATDFGDYGKTIGAPLFNQEKPNESRSTT